MFNNIIDHNQLVAPPDHSIYIILSSLMFLIPSFHAFKKDQYVKYHVRFFLPQ
jgi:hypothetical protein